MVIACVHLSFLPWALGARAIWAQNVSLAFGLVALVVGLWPRRYRGELAPQGAFILHPWSRLLKFPVFWLGLLLFAYVSCQGLNPAYVKATAGFYWWLASIDHISWLPSGVDAPFEEMNAWRMLIVWGGAWSLSCGLWIGITRRASAQAILTTLAINGTLLALLGILQKVTLAKGVFWVITSAPSYFTATFFYKNHAGAYFNLIFAVTITLMAWHHLRALRRVERSSPAPVYAFIAVVLVSIIFLAGSRAAMILLIGYALAAVGILVIWRLRNRHGTTHPAATGLVFTAILSAAIISASFLNLDKGIEEIRRIATEDGQKAHWEPRVLARQATFDLVEMNPCFGWGAGSFRHIFPATQRNYERIYRGGIYQQNTYKWDHAHNDYAEALAELGVLGFLLPVLALLWICVKTVRIGVTSNPAYVILVLGLFMPLAHAWVDFPLYNPAILVTFSALWILLVRWLEIEAAR